MEKQENECACFPGEEPAVVEFATTSTHAAARLAASRALREDATPLGPRAGCGCPSALTSPAPALGGLPGLLVGIGGSARQSHLRQGPRCWFCERRTRLRRLRPEPRRFSGRRVLKSGRESFFGYAAGLGDSQGLLTGRGMR
ncbi:hypothetical protein HPB47_009356 [Ixodes persulcatus]|uniref:Uncharacterized protein n=1 Tax=Ixodes persulcatus TaxID=34615 RepID=A0AC60P291_IXOPE|nr:hypothetical protein HPB47_009356 [Ixodes persulcatus]